MGLAAAAAHVLRAAVEVALASIILSEIVVEGEDLLAVDGDTNISAGGEAKGSLGSADVASGVARVAGPGGERGNVVGVGISW